LQPRVEPGRLHGIVHDAPHRSPGIVTLEEEGDLTRSEEDGDALELGHILGDFVMRDEFQCALVTVGLETHHQDEAVLHADRLGVDATVGACAGKRRPLSRLAQADKALDLLTESASALKFRFFKEAAKLATEAKRHVDKGLSRLEALEPPDYDELQAYLQKTIDGYRLLSDGVASYVKGIKKFDPKLIREAAQKFEQGLQEVNDAAEELFRFLRSQ